MGEWVGSRGPFVHCFNGLQRGLDVGEVHAGFVLEGGGLEEDVSDDGAVEGEGAGAVGVGSDMDHDGVFAVGDALFFGCSR